MKGRCLTVKEIIVIIISAILVDNFVLTRFLGVCPFLGVSKRNDSAFGMGIAVTFVMVAATAVTFPIYKFILEPLGLDYLRTMMFILIIALFVQIVEMAIKKKLPPLYKGLGVFLPLITTNCAVLGVTLINIDEGLGFGKAIALSFGAGLGFLLALMLFSGVRTSMQGKDIPKMFKGVPATLIAAAIVSLAFMGFGGIV